MKKTKKKVTKCECYSFDTMFVKNTYWELQMMKRAIELELEHRDKGNSWFVTNGDV